MTNQHRVIIESIDAEAKGIARIDGKTVFIPGALPNEEVIIEIYKKKPNFDLARLIEIIQPSPERVIPKCPHFGICGGCSLQHLEFNAQIKSKEKVLIDNLKHIGNVEAKAILPAIIGKPWEYRHRARLSAKYVSKKNAVLVGFREKASPYVADMHQCQILPKHISELILPLRDLIYKFSIKDKIPQIEVAVGDKISILVLRVMEELNQNDSELLEEFVKIHSTNNHPIQIWLQPKGTDSCHPFIPLESPTLSYTIGSFNIDMPYYPTEFTQINPYVNNQMIESAIKLLELEAHDQVIDFFCGIGNFTLPIATKSMNVLGIEGSQPLITRALENAKHNKLDHKTTFQVTNLFTVDSKWLISLGKHNKWLIDPPRDGAVELIKAISPEIAPQKIVYVSCNPATLARDASILTSMHGYVLKSSGVMNMFPHTSHVESIAEFILPNTK